MSLACFNWTVHCVTSDDVSMSVNAGGTLDSDCADSSMAAKNESKVIFCSSKEVVNRCKITLQLSKTLQIKYKSTELKIHEKI